MSDTCSKQKTLLDFVEFLSSSDSECGVSNASNDVIVNTSTDDDADTNIEEKSNVHGFVEKRKLISNYTKLNQKKSETIALIYQLNTHIIALEKEKKSQLFSKSQKGVFTELEEFENKSTLTRSKEKKEIKKNLEKISLSIEQFKRSKNDVSKCASYLEKLKILMEEIESNIMHFKEKQRMIYEDLLQDEKNLSMEIDVFDKKFQHWEKLPYKNLIVKSDFEKNNKDVHLPKEVEEFEKFLTLSGGHQGGWDDYDQQAFLRLRKQHKDDNQLLSAAIHEIPTQSHEDIQQHIEWYLEYCILRERKREAIRLWKRMKHNDKEELLTNAAKINIDENKRDKRKEEQFEKERQERFKKLEEWKKMKESEESKIQEQADEDLTNKLKLKQAIEERRRFELKLQVEEYRLRKREEENILKETKEKFRKENKISQEEKDRIRERNDEIIESKRQQILDKEYEKEEKERRLNKLKEKVCVDVQRDPNRLFKLTEGWKRRKEEGTNNNRSTITSGSRMMPHRAVPTWRQNVVR